MLNSHCEPVLALFHHHNRQCFISFPSRYHLLRLSGLNSSPNLLFPSHASLGDIMNQWQTLRVQSVAHTMAAQYTGTPFVLMFWSEHVREVTAGLLWVLSKEKKTLLCIHITPPLCNQRTEYLQKGFLRSQIWKHSNSMSKTALAMQKWKGKRKKKTKSMTSGFHWSLPRQGSFSPRAKLHFLSLYACEHSVKTSSFSFHDSPQSGLKRWSDFSLQEASRYGTDNTVSSCKKNTHC